MAAGKQEKVHIRLWPEYMFAAKRVARARRDSGIANGRVGRDNFPTEEAEIVRRETVGAFGEAVIAQYFDLPPSALKTQRPDKNYEPDVGGVGVRASEYGGAHLLIRLTEHPPKVMVLVTGRINQPSFVIHGWIVAQDGKRPEWSRTRESRCYWVPQGELRPMSQLPGRYRHDCGNQPVHFAG